MSKQVKVRVCWLHARVGIDESMSDINGAQQNKSDVSGSEAGIIRVRRLKPVPYKCRSTSLELIRHGKGWR